MILGSDPHSYEEASYDPIWKIAMQEEFKSLQENETWKLVPVPSKRKLVQCKWVYRTKMAADGYELKYKDILVLKIPLSSPWSGL